MKRNDAEGCGCVDGRCTCGGQHGAEECCEEAWREQLEREEMETVLRENGIRIAMNQHICED